jgi:hypothetical protein
MFNVQPGLRLGLWKRFREELDLLSFDQAVLKVSEFWDRCPYIPFYLDYNQAQSWPDPWELINENIYCDLAKALGIVYTLHLTKHKSLLFPELRIYFDPNTRYYYHIAYLCHGKYVLNLIEHEVVNKEHINQRLKLKYCYTAIDLKLDQY